MALQGLQVSFDSDGIQTIYTQGGPYRARIGQNLIDFIELDWKRVDSVVYEMSTLVPPESEEDILKIQKKVERIYSDLIDCHLYFSALSAQVNKIKDRVLTRLANKQEIESCETPSFLTVPQFRDIGSQMISEYQELFLNAEMHLGKRIVDGFKDALYYCLDTNGPAELEDLSVAQRSFLFYNYLYEKIPSMDVEPRYLILPCLQLDIDFMAGTSDLKKAVQLIKRASDITKTIEVIKVEDIYSMCYLELIKMAAAGILVKKCKHCGKYFIITAKYKFEYCNRTAPGEEKTCKEIGAVRAYANKVKDHPVLEAYTKAYKAHNARVRYKSMTKEQFFAWSTAAKEMKDKALVGELSLKAFQDWLKI